MPSPGGATIGLCMIVRDEAAVIERCLTSVLPLIDAWTICDTGSADDTRRIVEDVLAGVPGVLHERPWRDFGHNRTELMRLAAGSADYLLLLDADMTLRRSGPLPALTADAYALRHAGDLEYWVPRLVRGDRSWTFVGATHEYLQGDGSAAPPERLGALVVEHHADGGARTEKFERDRRLLRAALEREPDDPRTVFYLAQTLRDLGDVEEAIALFRRRAAMGGWDEEAYYAAYQAAMLVGRTDVEAGIAGLREAAGLRPARGEAPYELARLLRAAGRHEEAHDVARRAAELPAPADLLFVHRDVHEWGLRFEQAIAAHWTGRSEEALDVADALLDEGRLPVDAEAALRESRGYMVAALAADPRGAPAQLLSTAAPSFRSGEIALAVDPPWPQFNPSIAAEGDGFRAVVRTAGYRIVDGRYELLTADGVVRTINYLLRLDRDLSVLEVLPIAEPRDVPPTHPALVEGFEDLRLFAHGERWMATATARDRNPGEMCEICLLELAENGSITRVHRLAGPDPARDEKNWMPFTLDGRVLLVYSLAPTVVLACDPASGALDEISSSPAPAWAQGLRGGSQGVPVAGGTLFVAHEVTSEAPRVYVHRFVLLDAAHRLAAVSPRFSFSGEPIELCAGLVARGDELVVTYGVGDASAWLGVLATEEVLSMLSSVRA